MKIKIDELNYEFETECPESILEYHSDGDNNFDILLRDVIWEGVTRNPDLMMNSVINALGAGIHQGLINKENLYEATDQMTSFIEDAITKIEDYEKDN